MNPVQAFSGNTPPSGFSVNTPLTEEQTTQVVSILSQYDPSSLSEEDTTAIRQAFREADITPSRELRQVIEAAGFDAGSLRGAEGRQGGGPPPPPPADDALSGLSQLKDILSQYDLSNLDSESQAALLGELEETGLLQSGLYVNVSI